VPKRKRRYKPEEKPFDQSQWELWLKEDYSWLTGIPVSELVVINNIAMTKAEAVEAAKAAPAQEKQHDNGFDEHPDF